MKSLGIFNDNTRILDRGHYLAPSGEKISVGYGKTTLYVPDELAVILSNPFPDGGGPPVIEMWEGTTGDSGRKLAKKVKGKVAILNFASARNPGGGYTRGTKAQEEDVCRCSLLYHSLLEQPEFYKANRACKSVLYTDHIIYTEEATFFRTDKKYRLLERDDVATLDVITAPAPNTGCAQERGISTTEIEEAFRQRAGYVLAVAERHKARNLVLGAWGCGVFRGDPHLVADAFGKWLEDTRFLGSFDRVVFAIPAMSGRGQTNLEGFKKRFE